MRTIRNLILTVAAGLALVACGNKGGANTADDMVIGSDKAPVTMVEYASVACPHCAQFNNNVWPAFKAKYVDTGQVKWVSREALTGDPRMASAGFLLARCAGKDKYFTVTDAIYRDQANIYNNLREGLLAIAKNAGLTEEQFKTCISDDKAINALNERVERLMRKDQISGTPTFMIGDKKVAESEVTLEQLSAAVEAAKAGK